jgi:hypothetical protein
LRNAAASARSAVTSRSPSGLSGTCRRVRITMSRAKGDARGTAASYPALRSSLSSWADEIVTQSVRMSSERSATIELVVRQLSGNGT